MRWLRLVLVTGLVATAAALGQSGHAQAHAQAREQTVSPPSVWTESSYASVFKDSGRSPEAGDDLRLDTGKNEYEAAQIVLRGPQAFTVNSIGFSALTGPSDSIAAAELSYNPVGYEYLNKPSDKIYPLIRQAPGDFPDRLMNQTSIAVPANQTQSVWIRVHVPATAAGGIYRGLVTVHTTAGDLGVPISVNARNVVIPPANQSGFTNVMWTNFLGLTSYDPGKGDTIKLFYDYDRYSPQWWQLIDNWADKMKQYRQNDLQLPMINLLTDGGSKVDGAGNYTFDFSRFDEVVQRFMAKGVVKRLEGFTQAGPWSRELNPQFPRFKLEVTPKNTGSQIPDYLYFGTPEADNWYRQFYPALREHVIAKGWKDIFWTHVSDEPNAAAGGSQWFDVAAKIRQYWPEVKLADATVYPMSGDIVKSADIVIPNLTIYSDGPAPFDAERARGKELWLYNCAGLGGDYLNRLIDQPQWQQRQTMWFAYSRGATGYLHWAYNNWQYAMNDQSIKGDGYIVRPDKAHNTIEVSTRYESLRDGLEDWEILNQLGKTNPGLAKDLATTVGQNGAKYSRDVSYMQRIRAIALDAAAGKPVVAKNLVKARTSGPKWEQVDLGRQGQVDGVHLRWGTAYASNYRVQISYNGTNWSKAAERSSDGGDDFIGLNAKTRYIRVEVTSDTPYELQSFEVSGNYLLQQNLAGGKAYTATAPSPRFPDKGREATDGVLADDGGDGLAFGYELTKGQHAEPNVAIDLGGLQTIGTVRVHAYEEYPDYRPDQITVATSWDGVNYANVGQIGAIDGDRLWYDISFAPTLGRYVRVTFAKTGTDKGTGEFVDDIEVYGAGQSVDEVPGAAGYSWTDASKAGHEVILTPTATGSVGRFDWSAAAGVKRDDWGGGPVAGKTTGFSWLDQQHALARSTNGTLLHWWRIEGETATHTADWGGDAAGDPTAVVWSGQQHAFARSSTGDLQHWWWDPADGQVRLDKWGGAPGPIVGTPSSYVWGNQLHVVARGANNHLYHWWWSLGDYEPHFADWGGEAYSDPATFVWLGQQHIYTQAADGQLYHWFFDPADGLHQVKWTGAPGKFVGAPMAFKTANQQHVVARGPGNTLYHWWWDRGTATVTFEDKGGEVYSDPIGFAFEDQLQFFAQSSKGTLSHWWWTPPEGWQHNDWGGSVRYPS